MAPSKSIEKFEKQGGRQTVHTISPSTSNSISIDPEEHEERVEDFVDDAPSIYGFHEVAVAERPALNRVMTAVSTMSTRSTDAAFEVDWEEDDKENPRNMSIWGTSWAIFSCAFATTTILLYSSAYTAGIPQMMRDLHIKHETTAILGLTTYLLGLAVGAVICAPLSEMFGRRPIYLGSLAIYVVLVIPCALANNIGTIMGVRFVAAMAGSSCISNAPGTINDVVSEEKRALAYSFWSIGPMNGPVIGPIIGGFIVQYLGWRWIYWITMILAGASLCMLFFMKETYAPTILRKRVKKLRDETGDSRYWSRYDEKMDFWPLLFSSLWRPFAMTFTEPILWFWDLYVSVIYAILYLSFVAYPIIFRDIRGWAPGLTGLAFCGIGLGNLITIFSEPLLRRMINAHKHDPETGRPPPEAMVSAVCIAAVLIPVGQFWFAWTCTPNVHWIVPILAGVPFGAGNGGIFIYGSNYVVHSYGMYAASALAGNTFLRSVTGGVLPLAGPAMYAALGPNWAGTLLGVLEVICLPIPFVFYFYGAKIRMQSKLIRSMQEDKQRLDAKREKARIRAARDEEREKGILS